MAGAKEYAAWIVANQDKKGTPEFDVVAKAYEIAKSQSAKPEPKANAAQDFGGLPFRPFGIDTGMTMPESVGNFMAGVGKAAVDTGRGLGQMVGAVSRQDVKEAQDRDAALMDTGAGFFGNVAGNIGIALAPGGALKGAGMAANFAKTPQLASQLSALGGSALAPKTIGGALGLGATMGLIQPSTSTADTLTNVALGGIATAAAPVIGRAVKTAKSAAEPFYEGGRQQILSRALREAAGGQQYADDAARRLAEASQPLQGPFRPGQARQTVGEIIPGSVPTAAQVAENPGIASLERAAIATNPAVTTEHTGRIAAQNAARIRALEDMAGSDGARQFARAELEATADDLYGQAFSKGVDLRRDAATGAFLSKAQQAARKGEITKLMNNPYIAEAAEDAQKYLKGDFKNIADPTASVEGLHYMQKALSDKINKATGNEARILRNARERLLTTIDALSPDYKAARAVFRDMAKPVNQMDTAAEIAKRSVTPRGNMTLDKFARGATDDAAATAQGFKRATLEGTMNPEQMGTLNALRQDLTRADFAQNAGRSTGSNTVQNLAYSNILNQAGVPNVIRALGPSQIVGSLLSRGADVAYGAANQRLSEQLARALLYPEVTAKLLTMQPNQRAALLANALTRGGASLGMMTPALLNAQQQ